jgi:hypothetical protein
MYDMYTICKNTQYIPDMYMKSVCFSAFILHISGTDKCKIGVRYLIFRPVLYKVKSCYSIYFRLVLLINKRRNLPSKTWKKISYLKVLKRKILPSKKKRKTIVHIEGRIKLF